MGRGYSRSPIRTPTPTAEATQVAALGTGVHDAPMKVLVTGGGGFLGSAIVRQLIARGDDVTIVARSAYPEMVALGARQIQGDLAEATTAQEAAAGQDAVIHTAAKAGIWGDYDDYYRSNVVATRHVLDACQQHGVLRLVYTSTPSVTFDGRDHVNGGPDLPYATAYKSHYQRTKCEAEKLVLGSDVPAVALRPHLIWGPGDPFILPGVITRQMAGKFARVGDGENRIDLTYVDNAAHAHVLALDHVPSIRGRAFFISDGEPVALWPFLDDLFAALDIAPVTRKVPAALAYAVGGLMEGTYKLLGKSEEPRMTRWGAQNLTTSHWYDMGPARDAFGYDAIISREEAWTRTIADLKARGLCGSP